MEEINIFEIQLLFNLNFERKYLEVNPTFALIVSIKSFSCAIISIQQI